MGYLTAAVAGLRLLVGVLAGGAVIGSLVVPGGAAAPAYGTLSPATPYQISLPALEVTAPVVPIALAADQSLDPPRDYHQVGWWDTSAKPGARHGQTVITGHTLHTGGASMNELGRLTRGDLVDVRTKRGTMRYAVQQVKVLSRARLAEESRALFGQDRGRGRLVLVTCTDWNGSFYESNVVVLAKPLGSPV
ncbi:class F sortase [Nocardioides sp.]|uniref:class F sortase n=1 Tax=Nocardioides sp. TaxID=35761 RepID=UPI0039E643F8